MLDQSAALPALIKKLYRETARAARTTRAARTMRTARTAGITARLAQDRSDTSLSLKIARRNNERKDYLGMGLIISLVVRGQDTHTHTQDHVSMDLSEVTGPSGGNPHRHGYSIYPVQ